MSSATYHAPVAVARPPRGWSFKRLFRPVRYRRRSRHVFVAVMSLADLPPE